MNKKNAKVTDLDKQEKITDLVRTKLQETGDLERLRCFVRRRLAASGWKTEVQKEIRAGINEVEYQTLTVQEIYDKIEKSGIKVDQRLKEEGYRKIKHMYKEALKQEALQQDALKQEAVKKEEALKKEAPKQDTPKRETLKRDALRQKATRQDVLGDKKKKVTVGVKTIVTRQHFNVRGNR